MVDLKDSDIDYIGKQVWRVVDNMHRELDVLFPISYTNYNIYGRRARTMKINKGIFLVATAEAMQNNSTKKLFKAEPVAFDMFSLFAFAVFNILDGKDITEDSFHSTVADVLVQASPEKISDISMIKQLALIKFSLQIWEELEKTGQIRRQ